MKTPKPVLLATLAKMAVLLAVVAWTGTSVWADIIPPPSLVHAEYAARVTSNSQYNWDGGFWWIPNGGTPFGLDIYSAGAPPTELPRAGAYYHLTSTMAVGEGYGINLRADNADGNGATIVYLVSAYVYDALESSDVLVSLVSTNAGIGVYPGRGTVSACTALRGGNCQGTWGPICYLTNNVGTLHPEIEFHYVSGSNGRFVADCISFQGMWYSYPSPSGMHIGWDDMGNLCVDYSGAPSTPVVLVRSFDPSAPFSSWEPIHTNSISSGRFYVPVADAPFAFFRLKFL